MPERVAASIANVEHGAPRAVGAHDIPFDAHVRTRGEWVASKPALDLLFELRFAETRVGAGAAREREANERRRFGRCVECAET